MAREQFDNQLEPSPDHSPNRPDAVTHRAITLIAARPDLFFRQGFVVATWRRRSGTLFGPYFLLRYRQDGRQRTVYLGRPGPVADRVREMLATLQAPLRQKRSYDRMERQCLASFRANKAHLAELLRPYGLRLHGMQVRGSRTSPLKFWLPRRGSLIPSLPRLPTISVPRVSMSLTSLLRRFTSATSGHPKIPRPSRN